MKINNLIQVLSNKLNQNLKIVYLLIMETFQKNEFWMIIFSFGLLYWLFNPSILMTLVMIIPLLLATISKK